MGTRMRTRVLQVPLILLRVPPVHRVPGATLVTRVATALDRDAGTSTEDLGKAGRLTASPIKVCFLVVDLQDGKAYLP